MKLDTQSKSSSLIKIRFDKKSSEAAVDQDSTEQLFWKTLKPFKNDEKCFLFHLKSPFRSQVFKFLSWLFGHVEKTARLQR